MKKHEEEIRLDVSTYKDCEQYICFKCGQNAFDNKVLPLIFDEFVCCFMYLICPFHYIQPLKIGSSK